MAKEKLFDYEGLAIYDDLIKNEIDKQAHSHDNKTILDNITASFTIEEKTKLSGIASGAEVNQNAFSNVKVGSTTVTADTKTDTLTLEGSNVTITPDTTNDKVTIGITKANVTSALGYTPPTTNTTYGAATSTTLGLVKSGTDITVDSSGNVSVNDDSHNHTIANIDGLQTELDRKAESSHTHSGYVNQNAFSNVKVGTTTVSADTTTDTLTIAAGDNITITPDATNDKITISSTDTKYTHPSHTAKSNGLYKVTIDSSGHVSAATAVAKSDITALGIPSSDTNTHYTSKTVLGESTTSTENSMNPLSNGGVYINHVENGSVTSSNKIYGTGATTVTNGSTGEFIINSTDTKVNTKLATTTKAYLLGTSTTPTSTTTGTTAVADTGVYLGTAAGSLYVGSLTVGTRRSAPGSSSITSGGNNIADAQYTVALGGTSNAAKAPYAGVLGGYYNNATEDAGFVIGGYSNNVNAASSIELGGHNNTLKSPCSGILSGHTNTVDIYSDNSVILGGHNNTIIGYEDGEYYSYNCAIIGGDNNQIDTDANGAVIVGGVGNRISNMGTAESAAIIGGYHAYALDYNTVIGRYNSFPTEGATSGTDGDVLVVGIGTSTARKNGFRVAYNGNCYAATAMNSTGADYAEYWEWADGNPENEDRIGRFVVFKGDKIQIADENSDIRKVGIISGNPAIVGDNYADEWYGKYLKDIYGRYITEHKVYPDIYEEVQAAKEVELTEEEISELINEIENNLELTDEEKEIEIANIPITKTVYVTETVLVQKAYEADEYVLNPNYDPEQEYIPREKRSEWSPVGTHGKLVVIDDGTCEADGFCVPTTGGIATASDDGFYVMERIDETHIRVYIK